MHCHFKTWILVTLGLISSGIHPSDASVTRYVSFGMPEALLREHLKAAGMKAGEKVLFRGLPESGGYPAFIQKLLPLIQSIPKEQRPRIGVDPKAFDEAQISRVPVMVGQGFKDARSARYPIIESDPRALIKKSLSRISAAEWKARLLQSEPQKTKTPLPRATVESTLSLNPRLRLPNPVLNDAGKVLAAAGQSANPLLTVPNGWSFLIMNSGDQRQIEAVIRRLKDHQDNLHLFAEGGVPGVLDQRLQDLSKALDTPIYPLPERWIAPLRITALPAEVTFRSELIEVRQWPP